MASALFAIVLAQRSDGVAKMKMVIIALAVAGVLTLAGLGRPAGPAAAAHVRPGGSGSARSSVVSLRGSHPLPRVRPAARAAGRR
jgi:hypothetical protein